MTRAVGGVTWRGAEVSYAAYLVPGLLVMNAFFAGQAAGFPLWIDRKTGELEVHFGLPVHRGALLGARALGGVASAVVQAALALVLARLIIPEAVPAPDWRWAAAVGLTALTAAGVALFYLGLCCRIENQETFNVVINLLNTPLILTSSIYYPVGRMPGWLQAVSGVNPLTHGAALVRTVLTAGRASPAAGVGEVGLSALFLALFVSLGWVETGTGGRPPAWGALGFWPWRPG
jgi:ABC-type multidrug transport system permease subunit